MRVSTKYRYAVVGSRTFTDYDLVKRYLDKYQVKSVVSGGARGADELAERYAREHNCDLIIYPADWDQHGKSAGYIRNKSIVEGADAVIAFWDGQSKGTQHTLDLARKQGLPTRIIGPDGEVRK